MDLQEMRTKRAQLHESRVKLNKEAEEIVASAEAESREITEDEQARLDAINAEFEGATEQIDTLDARIDRREQLDADTARLSQPRPRRAASAPLDPVSGPPARLEFESMGEFLHAVRFNQNDQRLQFNAASDQSMGEGERGGFAVPKRFIGDLLSVEPQDAIFRPRANVIAAGSPADSEISMPALDQSDAANMYGGVEVTWIGEGEEKPKTDVRLREVALKPKEVAAHTVVTDKLLRNWTAASGLISNLLRRAILAAEDHAFMSGNGQGKPLGVLSAGATVDVNRADGDEITYADIVAMYAAMKHGGQLVWITSQTTLPQLMNMHAILEDGDDLRSGGLLWQQSAVPGTPGTLIGIPVVLNERSPVLGDRGDLVLADLSYYLIKDGSGLFVDASPHVFFRENKTVIKAFWNVDGQPWLHAPLEQENGNTVSPFVALDDPAGT